MLCIVSVNLWSLFYVHLFGQALIHNVIHLSTNLLSVKYVMIIACEFLLQLLVVVKDVSHRAYADHLVKLY